MHCRVGITTDPIGRKKAWKSEYPKMKNWKESGPYSNRKVAQTVESMLASLHGCDSHHGGREPDNPSAKWYVYRFDYQ